MSLPNFVLKLIDDVAQSDQFIEYRTECGGTTKRGENFTGKITFFEISGTRNVDGNVFVDKKYLVLKTAPSNPSRREVFQVVPGFKCEVEMYTKVLPAFVEFQEEKNLKTEDKFSSFPEVHATICDEERDEFAIIMEDLRAKNFKMLPKCESISHDHAKLVMKGLAKYHAVSFAMKDQKPNLFQQMVQKGVFASRFMKDDLGYEMIHILDRSIDALNDEKHKKLIRDLKETYLEWVEKFANTEFIGESGVLLHGDCGGSNIIYKYETDTNLTRPSNSMFLDWQMSRYGPPMIDLFYFILSTTDKSFRDQYFQDLLNEYYSTLSATIEKLGSDPEKLYPLSRLQSDLSKFNRFPLLFALVSALFRVADDKHILDLDEYSERICNGERPKLILDLDKDTEILYKSLLDDAIVDVVYYCQIK